MTFEQSHLVAKSQFIQLIKSMGHAQLHSLYEEFQEKSPESVVLAVRRKYNYTKPISDQDYMSRLLYFFSLIRL
ncbi:MAG: hypothetical protein ACRCXZ_07115 [Patescibacteria group bacterium]